MMATTELAKIPDTIQSRSQVFEFRTITGAQIAAQLRRIADAEGITIADDAIALVARAAEGSMRDAQSALDQVIAFAGKTVGVDDVSTVLGLVGRDLLMDILDAVVAEDGPCAFALTERAVESGTDLKLVCRELSQVVRDMMVMTIDPSRVGDAELAPDERERLAALAREFSREDLMRAFDLLSTAEQEIRNVSHPRYYFEMILLRWMHLRKLVPLAELLLGETGTKGATGAKGAISPPAKASLALSVKPSAPAPAQRPAAPVAAVAPSARGALAPEKSAIAGNVKDALLGEIKAGKPFFYNTVVAQAQKIEVTDDRVTFVFSPTHRALREQFEQSRAWVETTAERVVGRRVMVESTQGAAPVAGAADSGAKPEPVSGAEKRDLKTDALKSSTIQAVLDVFPAEIRDVEEMEP